MRPVPKHIDKKGVTFEYLMVFAAPYFLLHTLLPVMAIPIGIGVLLIYVKLTAGKPAGFLYHKLYARGVPMRGLLSPKDINRTFRP